MGGSGPKPISRYLTRLCFQARTKGANLSNKCRNIDTYVDFNLILDLILTRRGFMPQSYQAPVGAGVGIQKFSMKPGGGLQLDGSTPAPAPSVPASAPEGAPPAAPSFESAPSPTPFERLYPGVDPTKVEMRFDDKSNKIRFAPIETEPPPEAGLGLRPAETPSPAPKVAPSAPETDPVARLQAQLDRQNQMMQAVIIASATGRPIGEVLGLQAAQAPEPDYSGLDLYDDAQRAQFIKQLRADALQTARSEVEAQMRGHLPQIQGAQRY